MAKMWKQIYLVRGLKTETYPAFGKRIEDKANQLKDNPIISALSYTITREASPRLSIIPFSKQKVTAISLWKNDEQALESLMQIDGFEGAYQVTETLPVVYKKNWANGECTPGVCLLTLFKQKKNIDYKTFLDRWHNSHTPLSLKIHPLWHYNRNVVEKRLSETSAGWDGIVEEHMRTRPELTNPFKFFGGPPVIIQRMINVYTDTRSFLDYKTIEPYFVAEYWLKSK